MKQNVKRDLIEFVIEIRDNCEINGSIRIKARKLLDAIKDRPREPEAINRNEQAKEFKKLVYCNDIPNYVCSMISCEDCEVHKCNF